jgi:hypothetical protein
MKREIAEKYGYEDVLEHFTDRKDQELACSL